MPRPPTLLLLLALVRALSAISVDAPADNKAETPRDRACCRYARTLASASGVCASADSCVVAAAASNDSSLLLTSSPGLDLCNVVEDSKRDNSDADAHAHCLARPFSGAGRDWLDHFDRLPFSVAAYLFADGQQAGSSSIALPAVEVRIDYDARWTAAKFRLWNRDDDACAPRCVEILKNHLAHEANASLRYDCEVGFYTSREKDAVVITSGDNYQLDICMDHIVAREDVLTFHVTCGSFLFVMPEVVEGKIRARALPLLERAALEADRVVALHIPDGFLDEEDGVVNRTLVLYAKPEGKEEWSEVLEKEYPDVAHFSTFVFSEDDLRLGVGQYKIAYRDSLGKIVIASFAVPEPESGAAIGVAIFVIVAAVTVLVLGFCVYRRYVSVKTASVVNPTRLLESGRIKGKSVFVITNVDNRHHIDVVMAFNRYLKTYCAVKEVYYALDDETGVRSQPEHDPWKWAQDVADKLAATEDSCIVFIGSPPPAMGLPIYKDLPNNQAFVAAKYLKHMVDEHRVAILLFPYSDPGTIPTLVPEHVRDKPFHLPRDMNDFLCQLLDVKKRALFSCLPIALVKPQVLPHDLTRYAEGEKLLDKIGSLSALVSLHQAASSGVGGAGSTMSRTEETMSTMSDSEEKTLLTPKKAQQQLQPEKGCVASSSSELKVEIEPHIMSLRDGAALKRDRRINPEFANA